MSEHRYDIRISESCGDTNPLMVERQAPDIFTCFLMHGVHGNLPQMSLKRRKLLKCNGATQSRVCTADME